MKRHASDLPRVRERLVRKSVLGYRAFLRRGLNAVSEEWTLIGIAWNLKRLFTLYLEVR